jgi:hypothetical protein
MLASVNNRAVEIKRVATGPLHLGDLPVGKWRLLTKEELVLLGAKEKEEPNSESTKKVKSKSKAQSEVELHGVTLTQLQKQVKITKMGPSLLTRHGVQKGKELDTPDKTQIKDEDEEYKTPLKQSKEAREEEDELDGDFDEEGDYDDIGNDEYEGNYQRWRSDKPRANMFNKHKE